MPEHRGPHPDEPVLATFRFGPSFRVFASLWWLMGPVTLVVLLLSVARGGDPVNLFIFLFLASPFVLPFGVAIQRMRVDITESFVVIGRLRSPIVMDRVTCSIKMEQIGGTPMAFITDRLGTRRTCAVTAMRADAQKARSLAAHVPVTVHGTVVRPLAGGQSTSTAPGE